MLEYVSASQVSKFEECPRRWYEAYVLGNKQPTSPAMELGTLIHAEIEYYLLNRSVRASDWSHLVHRLAELIPRPDVDPHLLVEHKIVLPTPDNGPEWIGFIDLGWCQDDGILVVDDFKTKNGTKWIKTPEDLLHDVQMTSYAVYMLAHGPKLWPHAKTDVVRLRHLNIRTDEIGPRTDPVKVSEILATREQVISRWMKSLASVSEMVRWDEVHPETSAALPPTTSACSMYGGCFYKPVCGFDVALEALFNRGENVSLKESNNSDSQPRRSLKERLAMAASPTPVLPPGGAVGVLSPDAPDREAPTPPEIAAEAAAPTKRKKTPKAAPPPEVPEKYSADEKATIKRFLQAVMEELG